MKILERPPNVPERLGKTAKKRILIVDDHAVVRRGLRSLFAPLDDLEACGDAETSVQALEAARRLLPDAVVLDLSMPGANGIELIKSLLAEHPNLPILTFSMHEESVYALRSLRAGAKGYVMKSEPAEQVIAALRTVLDGEIHISHRFRDRLVFRAIQSSDSTSPVDQLSDRELEVLQHLGKGSSTREIAEGLNLSVKTIETHRAHIKDKLGFKDAAELVRFAVDWVTQSEG